MSIFSKPIALVVLFGSLLSQTAGANVLVHNEELRFHVSTNGLVAQISKLSSLDKKLLGLAWQCKKGKEILDDLDDLFRIKQIRFPGSGDLVVRIKDGERDQERKVRLRRGIRSRRPFMVVSSKTRTIYLVDSQFNSQCWSITEIGSRNTEDTQALNLGTDTVQGEINSYQGSGCIAPKIMKITIELQPNITLK